MKSKKKLIIIISIICICLTLIGVSFAYYIANFSLVNKDNSDSTVTTTSLVEAILEIPNKDDNINIYPGYKTSKEYIVKGKGTSTSKTIEASLIVKPNLGDFSKYVYWSLYKSDEEITCSNSLDNDSIGISLKSECNIPESAKLVLSGNGDITYINLTINYDTNDKYYLVTEYLNSDEDQSNLMNKEFNIDVSLEPLEDSIQNKIIAQLDTTGKCPTANSDGSIRMIYDGTTAHENSEESLDRQIGIKSYNKARNDNAYLGYMYGTPNSTSYEETHANINSSLLKIYLDNWYENNILNSLYSGYVADNVFCNDRFVVNSESLAELNNLGYGLNNTNYRWNNDNYSGQNQKKTLICPQKNDAFTVNNTILGNGNLTYPIGLITTDEVVLAGGLSAINSNYYLYTGHQYWTMSSDVFNDGVAYMRDVNSYGSADGVASVINSNEGVKPVINLKPNSLKYGTGTINNPYTVE